MPTQRRFEGPTLAAVLAKIQEEIGSGAKIASAQKIRSGGVMGFFQKERYEILVDLDAAAPAAGVSVTPPVVAPTAAAETPAAPVVEPIPEPTTTSATSLMDLAEQFNKADKTPQGEVAPRNVSTESDSFAEVLSRIAYQSNLETPPPATVPATVADEDFEEPEPILEPEPEPEVVEDEAPAPSSSDEVRESTPEAEEDAEPIDDELEEAAESAEEDTAVTGEAHEPEAAAEAEATEDEAVEAEVIEDEPLTPSSSDEVRGSSDAIVAEDTLPEDEALDPRSARMTETEDALPEDDEPEVVEAAIEDEVEDEPVREDDDIDDALDVSVAELQAEEPIKAEVVPAKPAAGLVEPEGPRTRKTDSPLFKLGVPAVYIPDEIPEDIRPAALQKTLAAALDELPKAPKIRPSKGAIICVVGDREEAMWTAEELAIKWNRPKEDIVLASQNYRSRASHPVVRSVRVAEDSRRSWSRRAKPTIVVVDTPLGSEATSWAEHILTALEPIATYGVADATRKSEDIAAWVDSIGGVDALALNHVRETVSPASVLATGIPVDTIDGHTATPSYWAMLLAERLTAA